MLSSMLDILSSSNSLLKYGFFSVGFVSALMFFAISTAKPLRSFENISSLVTILRLKADFVRHYADKMLEVSFRVVDMVTEQCHNTYCLG